MFRKRSVRHQEQERVIQSKISAVEKQKKTTRDDVPAGITEGWAKVTNFS